MCVWCVSLCVCGGGGGFRVERIRRGQMFGGAVGADKWKVQVAVVFGMASGLVVVVPSLVQVCGDVAWRTGHTKRRGNAHLS